MEIKGKTVFITGAASGIGLETAKKFICEGANVTIYSRGTMGIPDGLFEDSHILLHEGDVCDRDEVGRAVNETMKKFGSLDVLINNAGVAQRKRFEDILEDEWNKMLNVNLCGMFIVTQEALKAMDTGVAETDHDGCTVKRKCIINISSGAGLFGIPELSIYSATKAAVIAFTQALSGELVQSGIDVITITPGSVDTGMFKKLFEGKTPHHSPEDVADVIYKTVIGEIKPDNRMIVDTFYHQRV
jgi:3-oxoacyl-[acyl-carrier protein] reductase